MTELITVFTAKSPQTIFEQGGSGYWKLDPERVRRCKFVLMVANSQHRNSEHPSDAHGRAFMIGRVSGVRPANVVDYGDSGDRWVIEFAEFCEVGIENAWAGYRNPVKYGDVDKLPIEIDKLDWMPFPEDQILDAELQVPALSISEAKAAIAKKLGISADAIEIVIRA